MYVVHDVLSVDCCENSKNHTYVCITRLIRMRSHHSCMCTPDTTICQSSGVFGSRSAAGVGRIRDHLPDCTVAILNAVIDRAMHLPAIEKDLGVNAILLTCFFPKKTIMLGSLSSQSGFKTQTLSQTTPSPAFRRHSMLVRAPRRTSTGVGRLYMYM